MDTESRTREPSVTRRNLLKTGAAGALGAAAATAITATPASAADGDPLILGQENVASSPTQSRLFDNVEDSLDIFPAPLPLFPGRVLRVVGGLGAGSAFSAFAQSGTAIFAIGQTNGVIGQTGRFGVGVTGSSGEGIGVHGRSEVGTGIKAEGVHPEEGGFGTAFEAVGPVKFSTSGLADVAASTDRVTVNPGVPISPQSKVLAMLQGNSGNKAMVERVEVNPAAETFQVVLTKIPARPVQIAWFLMS
jgi:hypothetical protein